MTIRANGGRAREALVLGGGLAAAAALTAAAWLAPGDPQVIGAATVARRSAEVADGVEREWQRLAAGVELLRGTPEQTFSWTGTAARAEEIDPGAEAAGNAPGILDLNDLRADDAEFRAFDLLFDEARRRGNAEERAAALLLIEDALKRPHDDAREIEARLERLRLTAASGDAEATWRAWGELDVAAPGSLARDGTAVVLLGALSALPALAEQPDRVEAVLASVGGLWASDALALPASEWEPSSAAELLGGGDPTRAALRRALEAFGSLPKGVAAVEQQRRARGLQLLLEGRDANAVGALELFDLNEHLALIAEAGGATRARVLPRVELERALLDAAAPTVPEGFRVVFDGATDWPGEPVRGRAALAGDAFGFTLRHDDPASLARGEAARITALRYGLFAAAGLLAVLAVLTWRTLVRERRLADLRAAFVASVSHELRTPLASILLMAENLEDGRAPEASRGRYHRLIRREALRLRRLVDDVLDVSRLERGEAPKLTREDVDVPAFLAALEDEARERVEGDGGTLAFEADDAPRRLHADGEALRRAVLNLVDNAMKHSGDRTISVNAGTRADALVLGVRDRGRGIAPALRRRVFEPFERLNGDGPVGGAGLGLSIVREIARAHGGEALALEPADGGPGARFELCVPLEPERSAGEDRP